MKVVSSLRPLCKDCYIVKRGRRVYLRCKSQPRHKRRQGFSTLIDQGGVGYLEGQEVQMREISQKVQVQ